MNYIGDIEAIKSFQDRHPEIAVSYGGDGEILKTWREAKASGKAIYPVRDYGRCEKHARLFSCVDFDRVVSYRQIICDCPQSESPLFKYKAISEIQVKSEDVTSALRMDIYVNSRRFLQNVIADGIICSTAFGATGYFSSIARTLFIDGMGFAFIAPTLGVNNLVLPAESKIEIRLVRSAAVTVAADKTVYSLDMPAERPMRFYLDPAESVKFVGLDEFHCPECRANRHGTALVNQYLK